MTKSYALVNPNHDTDQIYAKRLAPAQAPTFNRPTATSELSRSPEWQVNTAQMSKAQTVQHCVAREHSIDLIFRAQTLP